MKRSQFLRVVGAFAAGAAGFPLAGCGGGGGPEPEPAPAPPPPPAPPPRTFVYVANNVSSDVSVYEVAGTGMLNLMGTVPAEGVRSVAVHPSGRFAHVAQDAGTISVFTIDPGTGMLARTPHVTTIDDPSKLFFHPSGKFAYLPGFENVLTYTVDANTGALTSADPLMISGELVRGFAVDPAGGFVYVTSSAGTIASYSVDVGSGSLAFRSSAVTGEFPRQIAVTRSGNFLFVARAEGAISAHAIDANGQLGAANAVDASNISSIAVEPSGRFLYVLTSSITESFVSLYSIGSSGELNLEGETPTVAGVNRLLAISPSGRFLYMTHLESNAVHAFEINKDTGALAELTPSLETGADPVDITVADIPQ